VSVATTGPAVLDDVDSRPGSVTSLVRTVLGLFVRDLGGWVAVADLTRLLEELGVPSESTRIAVTRLKKKGVLEPEPRDRSGYRLSERAVALLERGDARIFGFRTMQADDAWWLVAVSVPETDRPLRHQLRRRLTWTGCGSVAPGVWVCPQHHVDDALGVVEALGLAERATAFACHRVAGSRRLSEDVARWWDLDTLGEQHRAFVAAHARGGAVRSGRAAFRRSSRVVDDWRPLPYVDPGLPARLLPAGWPGHRSARIARTTHDVLLPAARSWVREVTTPS
jgi:phenylacetic acid degradation operon negative regulatory protein